MGPVVLDTSVIIAALDPTEALSPQAQDALRGVAGRELIVPAVAYAEVLVGALRRGGRPLRTAEEFFAQAIRRIEPITPAIAAAAARIRAKQLAIGLPDALIIATGEALGAQPILTADARWRAVSRRVSVVGGS